MRSVGQVRMYSRNLGQDPCEHTLSGCGWGPAQEALCGTAGATAHLLDNFRGKQWLHGGQGGIIASREEEDHLQAEESP